MLIYSIAINAQSPQGFNYQATVRNAAGALIVNQNVYFKFNIMLNSSTSVPIFSETHYVPTDDLGEVSLVVGTGTATTGTFSSINWANGTYYLGIELNTGTGYVAMGTTQLLSVPYALYANTAGNSQTPNLANVLTVNNNANNLQIKSLADPTDAQDAVTNVYLLTQIANLQTQITALQGIIGVPIGTQIWQSTNLNATTYQDGTPIPQVTDPTQWSQLTTGAWCYYNNDATTETVYGKLYNWYAAAGIYDLASQYNPSLRKQLAPQGWHVPSIAEFTILSNFLGGFMIDGGKLKESGTAHWNSPNSCATNSSGFSALPGGIRDVSGNSQQIGYHGAWWTSSDYIVGQHQGMFYDIEADQCGAGSTNGQGTMGCSVRCVKD